MSANRVNLICHGMMALWQQSSDQLSILIPDEGDVHTYLIGSPATSGNSPFDGFKPLPKGELFLEGVTRGALSGAEMAEQINAPVLRRDLLTRTNVQRTEIHIPPPHAIRPYCGIEVPADVIRQTTPPALFARLPAVVHDVMVLSWLVEDGVKPSVKAASGEEFPIAGVADAITETTFFNIGVYAQPAVATSTHHGHNWNKMMEIVGTAPVVAPDEPGNAHAHGHAAHAAAASVNPDLNLALANFLPDGPPRLTAIGCSELDLFSLTRLKGLATDRSGCGFAAVLML